VHLVRWLRGAQFLLIPGSSQVIYSVFTPVAKQLKIWLPVLNYPTNRRAS